MIDLEEVLAANLRLAEQAIATRDKLRAELTGQRVTYPPVGGEITVTFDGNGKALDLRLAPGLLRSATPVALAERIAGTFNEGRRAVRLRRAQLAGEP